MDQRRSSSGRSFRSRFGQDHHTDPSDPYRHNSSTLTPVHNIPAPIVISEVPEEGQVLEGSAPPMPVIPVPRQLPTPSYTTAPLTSVSNQDTYLLSPNSITSNISISSTPFKHIPSQTDSLGSTYGINSPLASAAPLSINNSNKHVHFDPVNEHGNMGYQYIFHPTSTESSTHNSSGQVHPPTDPYELTEDQQVMNHMKSRLAVERQYQQEQSPRMRDKMLAEEEHQRAKYNHNNVSINQHSIQEATDYYRSTGEVNPMHTSTFRSHQVNNYGFNDLILLPSSRQMVEGSAMKLLNSGTIDSSYTPVNAVDVVNKSNINSNKNSIMNATAPAPSNYIPSNIYEQELFLNNMKQKRQLLTKAL